MDTAALKKEITEKLNQIHDAGILENLDLILNELVASSKGKDFWDDLTEEEKKNIEISLQQIKQGKTIPHEEVQAQARQWLKK
jgi:hypothetical protein